MYNYSIMPLDPIHVDEVCADIEAQYKQGVTSCALFCMTLMPEGNPVIPKAERMCEIFDAYYEKLHAQNIPCGMLMQASIGHGYPLDEYSPYQRLVNLPDGSLSNTTCPYDPGFRDYIRHTMNVMASHHPDVIMVDDDFRLIGWRSGHGCYCPAHQKAFEERAGFAMSREEMWQHLQGLSEEDEKIRNIFIETQLDSLVGAARAMREGIDAVNPKLPGVFCCVGPACEASVEIATILSGEGNPVVIRLNNGNYSPEGARYLSNHMLRAATQVAILRRQGHVDAFLAETDTCPQNRYSTGAQSLHAHFTGTILEGASGAKHWITRLGAYEPGSGKAYRKKLADNAGFYEALSQIVPQLTWTGLRIPVSDKPVYGYTPATHNSAWATNVLERLGLPIYFSAKCDGRGITCIDGTVDCRYSDEEMKEIYSGAVFTDGDAAERITNRGLAHLMGVSAKRWTGPNLSGETLPNGKSSASQIRAMELTPLDDSVRIDTRNYHNGHVRTTLCPGVTVYKNELGGTAITFCGATMTKFNHEEAFSFLNESRKAQLIDLVKEFGDLPVYYPGDAEVYLKAAYMPDNTLFCAFFNIGLDPIDKVELVCPRSITSVEILSADGKRTPCAFTRCEETGLIEIDAPVYTLNPVAIFLK